MNKKSDSIPKQPALKPAEDYYRLRREGIGFIEQMGSRLWTDYNPHDPGITILEALSYAMTDLAFRIGWDIQDLLAPVTPSSDPKQPFPDQSFFTAKEILTVNPCTPDDFRRLLIDLDGVRNAWVFCKECACDLHYYAWCENDKDQLLLSYQKPSPNLNPKKVEPLGLYEILLELETDPELGDLNNRKVEHPYSVFDSEGIPHRGIMEMRFPAWELLSREQWKLFLESNDAFLGLNGASFSMKVLQFGAARNYDMFTDATLKNDADRDDYLRSHWRDVLYVSFEIALQPGGEKVVIEHATLRIFGDVLTANDIKSPFEDITPTGLIQRYRNKLLKVAQIINGDEPPEGAKELLHANRNLDEDYCRVKVVDIEDIAACADVEVEPDADIEWIQARIWFEIEQYFNPPVPFYTLQELIDADIPVEDIFNGPALKNGFIKSNELAAAGLKTILRTSDIINRLMDIEGVVAVNNLLLTKYDEEGVVVKGAADPIFNDGKPRFDANRMSAAWLLYVSELHQPRLYHNLSRFLFYKNGLPFKPRMDEAYDTLTQLHGEAERPKIKNALNDNDLPVPSGAFRNPEDYCPVQYSFPLTYGIGPEGLPSHVSNERRAQAKQLKAYLMVFEQLLGNALAQVAHVADLFSLDPAVKNTYFFKEFSESVIRGYDQIKKDLDKAALEKITETPIEFYERRNRFLDHILARFGEQFSEYALLLTNFQGRQVALDRLIDDKISFLKAYPLISQNRGKAFNHIKAPCSPDNIPGLKKRISLLLGYPDLIFSWLIVNPVTGKDYKVAFQLKDRYQNEKLWFSGNLIITSSNPATVTQQAFQKIVVQMTQLAAYQITEKSGKFRLELRDNANLLLGNSPEPFDTKAEAEAFRRELLSWSANKRAVVVEHLLLRPKFPGDALYPVCSNGACILCGGEDPYSFRLTIVMPGWVTPYNDNLEMRGFADRTIREETPSHLLAKICWVGNDGFIENSCDLIVSTLVVLLETKGLTSDNAKPTELAACACATAIYGAFSEAFKNWYEDKILNYIPADALNAALETEFSTKIDPDKIDCTTVLEVALWTKIQAIMVKHFHEIALTGWQFERFEAAWCTWLEANTAFDWMEERLQERVEAILKQNLLSGPDEKLCQCATAILTKFGMDFYHWMNANIKAGNALEEFTSFKPDKITLCAGCTFKPGTDATIEALLKDRYEAYREVSYRLNVVVNLLSKLHNTYPGATLHDCDDGSDQNPVRLGSTALGNYPLRPFPPEIS